MTLKPTVCVDFDGTLCDHEYPGIGRIKPFAVEAMTQLRGWGYRIIIWSCRTCHFHYDVFGGDPKQPTLERSKVKEMINWLESNGIPFDEVDDGSRGKPLADFYIDDKAVRFTDWRQVIRTILTINRQQVFGDWMSLEMQMQMQDDQNQTKGVNATE